jgi:uncharacterized membrane protein YphA (DoxX/SURF4 family)
MPVGKKFIIEQSITMTVNLTTIGIWALRVIAAFLLLQTLFFKFTGAEESIYIFSTLGMEPWGRIGSGVLELIASILILYPRTTFIGAALGAGLMSGAIFFHLTKLGISVKNDGGLLFAYALIVFISCVALLFIYRGEINAILKIIFKKNI